MNKIQEIVRIIKQKQHDALIENVVASIEDALLEKVKMWNGVGDIPDTTYVTYSEEERSEIMERLNKIGYKTIRYNSTNLLNNTTYWIKVSTV